MLPFRFRKQNLNPSCVNPSCAGTMNYENGRRRTGSPVQSAHAVSWTDDMQYATLFRRFIRYTHALRASSSFRAITSTRVLLGRLEGIRRPLLL